MISDDEDSNSLADFECFSSDEELLSDDESVFTFPELSKTLDSKSHESSSVALTSYSMLTDEDVNSECSLSTFDWKLSEVSSNELDELAGLFSDLSFDDEPQKLEMTELQEKFFPKKYLFLLNMRKINDTNLRSHPSLFALISKRQYGVGKIIAKEFALAAMVWAQKIIACLRPVVFNAQLNYINYDSIPYYPPRNKVTFRVNFTIDYDSIVKMKNRRPGQRQRELKSGSVLRFLSKTPQKWSACVEKVDDEKCYLTITCSESNLSACLKLHGERVNIYELPNDFVSVSTLSAIKKIRHDLNHLVCPKPEFSENHEEYMKRKKWLMPRFFSHYNVSNNLTASQKDVIFAICNREHHTYPFVLNGPPGTGKTFTISQTVQVILQMNPCNRVLICAQSNMAADRVAEQLMRDFGKVLNKDDVLRLYSISKSYTHRDRQFDPIICCDHRRGTFLIPASFSQYRVVVCTLGCSAHLIKSRSITNNFSHIFVDEAGQASEGEFWIPVGNLANKSTSIILCGDPEQLGPVNMLDLSKKVHSTITSPLIRYMKIPIYQKDKRLSCQLIDCFRLPLPLVTIISRLFYKNTLLSIASREFRFNFQKSHMRADFPILFVSTQSVEIVEPNGFSYSNPVEARICVKFVKFFVERRGISPEQVGVISPYTHQSALITHIMKTQPSQTSLKKVVVNSVERFQGSEREVIIITTTRTKALGFMADKSRVNTSLTRCKNLLVVIGNEKLLRTNKDWSEFIDYCAENNAVKPWDGADDF